MLSLCNVPYNKGNRRTIQCDILKISQNFQEILHINQYHALCERQISSPPSTANQFSTISNQKLMGFQNLWPQIHIKRQNLYCNLGTSLIKKIPTHPASMRQDLGAYLASLCECSRKRYSCRGRSLSPNASAAERSARPNSRTSWIPKCEQQQPNTSFTWHLTWNSRSDYHFSRHTSPLISLENIR